MIPVSQAGSFFPVISLLCIIFSLGNSHLDGVVYVIDNKHVHRLRRSEDIAPHVLYQRSSSFTLSSMFFFYWSI